MTDVLVGATLPQFTSERDRLLASVRAAERAGLDSLWVFDHLWPLSGGKGRPVLEGWSTLAYLAAATERIRIGTLVTRSSLRNPALLAKMIATVAAIAPGRVIVAIGSGDEASRDENESFGIPYFSGDDRIGQLRSCVAVVRQHLHSDRVDHEDEFATVRALAASPSGPPVPLWLGGRADDVIETAAHMADGWNGWGGTPERFAQDVQQLVTYAGGREVEPSWGGIGVLAADKAAAASAIGDRKPPAIWGGPEEVAAGLAPFAAAGARHLILTPQGKAVPAFYELLGAEVKPRLAGYPRGV